MATVKLFGLVRNRFLSMQWSVTVKTAVGYVFCDIGYLPTLFKVSKHYLKYSLVLASDRNIELRPKFVNSYIILRIHT
jgi:hypothetical protein